MTNAPRKATGAARRTELARRDAQRSAAVEKKAPAKSAPAKKAAAQPAPGSKKAAATKPESELIDMSARFQATLAHGFPIKSVNDELFPGTSFAWRFRRGPVNAERDAELIKKATAWMDAVDAGKITPPVRVLAAAGPSVTRRTLRDRLGKAEEILKPLLVGAKDANAVRRGVRQALAIMAGEGEEEGSSDKGDPAPAPAARRTRKAA